MKTLLYVFVLSLCTVPCLSQSYNPEKKTTPSYKDGKKAFHDSLMKNIFIRPEQAYNECLTGIVVISFLVKEDGTIDSFITEHPVHPILDNHAYQFLYNTDGKWNPGTIDGKPYPMRKTMPFVYGLNRKSNASHFGLSGLKIDDLIWARYQECTDGDSYYKTGLKSFNKNDYQKAWELFNEAHKRDFIHLDAIDMLKRTSDILGLPCEVCKKLSLLAEYSDREIKRIRDKYCTKDFKPLTTYVPDPNTVFQYVYQMPVPKSSVEEYTQQHLQYPQAAKENCIQGTVLTRFVVKEDGSVDSVIAVAEVEPSLDAEAVRLVKSMKNFWQPGTLEGYPVKVFYTLPIKFSIDNPSCHNDDWYVAEGEKLYEQDKMDEALSHFRQAFKMNRTNFKAGYNYAATALSIGKNDEACETIKYLSEKGYKPAKELAEQYCE